MTPKAAQTVRRNYAYRIDPTRCQQGELDRQLRLCCDLYNAALEQRRRMWREHRQPIGFAEQSRQLTEARRELPWLASTNTRAPQEILRRLDRAFDKRLYLQGVGPVKVRWHREIPPDARVRQVTVQRRASGWHAVLCLELPAPATLPATGQQVGVDVGVTTFAALCTGELIPGPRALCASQRALERSQRNVSRKRRGSRRRQEARGQLARAHERVQRQRKAHAHATARVLVDGFDLIAMEDLRIASMTRSACGTIEQPETNVAAKGGLNRSILDAGWAQFTRLPDEKAPAAGRQLVRVPAHHTSQTCHECGHVDAANRRTQALFSCVACGHTAHANTNAAQNILRSARGPASRAAYRLSDEAKTCPATSPRTTLEAVPGSRVLAVVDACLAVGAGTTLEAGPGVRRNARDDSGSVRCA